MLINSKLESESDRISWAFSPEFANIRKVQSHAASERSLIVPQSHLFMIKFHVWTLLVSLVMRA